MRKEKPLIEWFSGMPKHSFGGSNMRIGQLRDYIVKHYSSPRRSERRYGILVLGPPGTLLR